MSRILRHRIPSFSRILMWLVCLCLLLMWAKSDAAKAQNYPFCSNYAIKGIAWSPDGERLAMMTSQGVHIYNRDLELIKRIKVPVLVDEYSTQIGPVWSPDGEWVVLPDHTPIENLGYGGAAGSWSIVDVRTGEVRAMSRPAPDVVNLVWSPDNRFIATLNYEQSLGLNLPYSQITVVNAVNDTRSTPREVVLDDLHIDTLAWQDNDKIAAHVDGLILNFSSMTLNPATAVPTFHPRWWISNYDGTREAAYKPDTLFYVRASDGDEQIVNISPLAYFGGEFISIGIVEEIHWLFDNDTLVGIYPRDFQFRDEYPELPRILQGTIVDAAAATEINHFMIEVQSEISRYAVSHFDGRIAVVRDRYWIDLWNPFTEEQLKSIEIPPMEFDDLCSN